MATPFQPKQLVPNLVTAASVVCGFLAVNAAANGGFTLACVLIFAAGICDILDGRLARMLDAGTPFGRELDSLCDAISFGLVPAVVLHFAVLRELGPLGAAIAIVYLLSGLFRLARFNLDHSLRATFHGIPIPAGAGYLISFVMLRGQVPAAWIAVGVLCVSVAMVSTLKVPNFKVRALSLPVVLLPILVVLFAAFLAQPSPWTWIAWNAYCLLLVALNYRLLARHESEVVEPQRQAA